MDYVIHEVRRPCEKSHGKALTKEEEILLLSTFKGTRFETMFAIALYCGLRPNEYSTARLSDDGKFIIAVNSKRKSKANVEYKKIPVTPMLRGYINENMDIQVFSGEYIRKIFHKLFKDKHILYDLRTTFYTRLRECGVSDAARNEFVGHSEKALEQTYTDLSDEYLLKEGEKFKY